MAKVGATPGSKTAVEKKTAAKKKVAVKKKVAKKKIAKKKVWKGGGQSGLVSYHSASSSSAKQVAGAIKLVSVPAPPATKAIDALRVSSSFPSDALSKIKTASTAGQVFRLDGGFVDGLRVQVRRTLEKSGKAGFDIEFKIAGPSRSVFEEQLTKKKAKTATFQFHAAQAKIAGGSVVLARTGPKHSLSHGVYSSHAPSDATRAANECLRFTSGDARVEYIPNDGPMALRGSVRIELRGTDAACSKQLGQLVNQLGLQEVFSPPSASSVRKYALMRLLWSTDPEAVKELGGKGGLSSLTVPAIEKALEKAGVGPKRLAGLEYREVAPGHFTVYDPELPERMRKAGLRYAYSTVELPEHVLSILKVGQKSTLARWTEGALINGMSSSADIASGGAQGVFSRLVTDSADGSYWNGRRYKIILKRELLGRLDIWGWNGDHYGRSWGISKDNCGVGLVSAIDSGHHYNDGNEIVSPVGNGPEWIACVVADDQEDKAKLVKYLQAAGWKPPGNKSLGSFVQVREEIDVDLLGASKSSKKKTDRQGPRRKRVAKKKKIAVKKKVPAKKKLH